MSKRAIVAMAILWTAILLVSITSTITLTAVKTATDQPPISDTANRYARLEQVRTLLLNEYYQPLDDDELMLGAIRGMLAAADDKYTFYYTPEEMERALTSGEGVYAGIGIQIVYTADTGSVVITRCYTDSPAQRAGILPGDTIVQVNDSIAYTSSPKDMLAQLSGKEGDTVRLTVQRDGGLKVFELTYEQVRVKQVEYQMLDDSIGYMIICEFSGDCVSGVKNALQFFKDNGAQGLVLDLRFNPGGLLSDVTQIADMLLPEGLVVYTQDRHDRRVDYSSDSENCGMKLAVLVNSMSASAAEILAGAIQDMGVGVLIGEQTYGKGIVQSVVPFVEDGSGMQLTTARYFTPNGRSIHGVGLTPDMEIELEDDLQALALGGNAADDVQLSGALAWLRSTLAGDVG